MSLRVPKARGNPQGTTPRVYRLFEIAILTSFARNDITQCGLFLGLPCLSVIPRMVTVVSSSTSKTRGYPTYPGMVLVCRLIQR